jgi:hypothetical protein
MNTIVNETEANYWAKQFDDKELNALADAGEKLNESRPLLSSKEVAMARWDEWYRKQAQPAPTPEIDDLPQVPANEEGMNDAQAKYWVKRFDNSQMRALAINYLMDKGDWRIVSDSRYMSKEELSEIWEKDKPALFPVGIDLVDCPKCSKVNEYLRCLGGSGNRRTAMVNYARTEASCCECSYTFTPSGVNAKPFLSPDWEKDWWENLKKIGLMIGGVTIGLFICAVIILLVGMASNAVSKEVGKVFSPPVRGNK